jgi:hypothetical protein
VFGEDDGRAAARNVLKVLNPNAEAEAKDDGGDCLEKSIDQGIPPLPQTEAHSFPISLLKPIESGIPLPTSNTLTIFPKRRQGKHGKTGLTPQSLDEWIDMEN